MALMLNNDDVKALLTAQIAIDAIEKSYTEMTTGDAVCRPHIGLQIPTPNANELYQWGTTEGGSSSGYFAIRMMSDVRYESEHEGRRTQEKYCVQRGTYCGLVFLFRVSNGEPLALLNDGYMQQIRVGVDAALGIKHMARENAEVIGMFGAGGLARSLVHSIREVRTIKTIQVYDPVTASRDAYAREMKDKYGIETIPLDNPQEVYKGADILAECTNAANMPVILGQHVEKGTHIVSVGRRLDAETFKRIDRSLRFGNATSPIGQPEIMDEHVTYVTPKVATGKIGGHSAGFAKEVQKDKVVYFKQLLQGTQGRMRSEDITYSERGNIMGAQFHAMAGPIYELAMQRGVGKVIPTEWFLQDIRS